MFFSRRFRRSGQRLLAAIAVLVMSVAALAPALANALGQSSPVMWVELCSADGSKRIAVDASGTALDPTQQSATHVTEHCPFCHIEHSPATIPPAPAPVVPQCTASPDFPALFYAAPRTSHAWAPSRSRGPPTLS